RAGARGARGGRAARSGASEERAAAAPRAASAGPVFRRPPRAATRGRGSRTG
ncbi:unnamed protein product, partial [Prorocentrum cordatum]